MSTKSSQAWGEDFHLYTEMLDDDNVYLRLDRAPFEAFPESVTVTIPRAIWEAIRTAAPTNLDAAFWTDEELRLYVKGQIEKDRQREVRHLEKCEPCRTGGECRGAFLFKGAFKQSEEEQIKYWVGERSRQRAIANQIAAYREGMIQPSRNLSLETENFKDRTEDAE